MRSKIKTDVNFRYVIRNPSRGDSEGASRRRYFKIEKRVFDPDTGAAMASALAPLPEERQQALDAINERFSDGRLVFEAAKLEVEELVETLYQDGRLVLACVYNTKNLKVAEEYLKERYTEARRTKLASFAPAEQETNRAIEALGELSIHAATPKQIQDKIDASADGDARKQRRLIFKMRAILNWLRPSERWGDRLVPWDEEYGLVKHLTDEEFLLVLSKLPTEHHKILAQVCFHLGCRVGEACALTLSDLKESRNTVLISKQIRGSDHKAGKVIPRTKNKRKREAFIFPAGVSPLKRWIEIKRGLTVLQRRRLAEVIRAACIELWPDDDSKHLVWHDLRHSYAIRLLDKGLTVDDIADMIGDSVIVAKKHYIGFIVSDARMDRIRLKVIG